MQQSREAPPGAPLGGDLEVLRIEGAIASLDGIDAVRLVPGTHRPVEELHVIIAPERRPDATKREVQALLLDRFDLPVDWHVIHIVPRPRPAVTTETPTSGAAGTTSSRLVLDTVHLAMRGRETTVGIELRRGTTSVHGAADPVGPASVLVAVARATLDAIGQAIDDDLELVSAEVVQVGGDAIAVATVIASDGRSREQLTGSAMVRGSEPDAVARAVLDATNRLVRD